MFLSQFSSSHEKDRQRFIRAIFWSVWHSYTNAQVFIFLLGRDGTVREIYPNQYIDSYDR